MSKPHRLSNLAKGCRTTWHFMPAIRQIQSRAASFRRVFYPTHFTQIFRCQSSFYKAKKLASGGKKQAVRGCARRQREIPDRFPSSFSPRPLRCKPLRSSSLKIEPGTAHSSQLAVASTIPAGSAALRPVRPQSRLDRHGQVLGRNVLDRQVAEQGPVFPELFSLYQQTIRSAWPIFTPAPM